MEFLERVVREDVGAGLVGDLQDERVTPADRPRRRGHQVAVEDGLFVPGHLAAVDPMAEGRVDHHDDVVVGVLSDEGTYCLIEVLEVRDGSTFGRDVGSVHDECGLSHDK